jgi:hypothetical protein
MKTMTTLQVIGILLCITGLWRWLEINSKRIAAIEKRLNETK